MRYFEEITNEYGTVGWVYYHEEGWFENDIVIELAAEDVLIEGTISKSRLREIKEEEYNTLLEKNRRG